MFGTIAATNSCLKFETPLSLAMIQLLRDAIYQWFLTISEKHCKQKEINKFCQLIIFLSFSFV
jgi:hypothetical protein